MDKALEGRPLTVEKNLGKTLHFKVLQVDQIASGVAKRIFALKSSDAYASLNAFS